MHRTIRATSTILFALELASCTGKRTSDGEQIVDAVARLLATDSPPICVNNQTNGDALAVWRNARHIVHGTERRTGWSRPEVLAPPAVVERTVIVADKPQTRVLEPGDPRETLPRDTVERVEVAARRLVLAESGAQIGVGGSSHILSRWWPIHRVWRSCPYAYELTKPSQIGSMAFVAVAANHWSTVYALEKRDGTWSPVARWAPWMY